MTEPVTSLAPRPVRWASLVQAWRDVTFLHWPVAPERVAGLLPPGTRPDVFDGRTYVGLVPFRMSRTGIPVFPRVPYLGAFCETNVRLYSVDAEGRRGVVFLSMDATRLLPVLAARIGMGLPYRWSSMRLRHEGTTITYTCRSRKPGSPGRASRARVEVGERITEPTRLELFLTARWGMHVSRFGRTSYLPNEHSAWSLHRARLLDLDDDLVAAAGLPAPEGPPVSVLHSPGVDVRFGLPSLVRWRDRAE